MTDLTKKLFEVARALLPAFMLAHKNELGGRTGIVLAISTGDAPIDTELLGELSHDVFHQKRDLAFEKLDRIKRNKEITSFRSENEELRQFGGGIQVSEDLWISASGFPPDLDQKFLLDLCEVCDLINYRYKGHILSQSYERVAYWEEKRKSEA